MKLSIITINRNNVEGLRKTMESVFAQTYRDIEYIIIDGASTDGSVDVIKEYEKFQISNFKSHISFSWVTEPDTGIYNAMNKGIRKATGEYCMFLNSGDFFIAADVLKRVFTQKIGVDIINARCNVSDKNRVVWTSPYLPKVTLKDLYFVGIPHQSTFIRRTLFDRYGLYCEDFRYNSDIDFWYRTIVFGEATTQGLDIITTDYNLEGQSTKAAQTDNYKKEMQEILSQGFLPKVLPDYDLWKQERRILEKYNWIEEYTSLQKILVLYRRIYKRIRKFVTIK